MSSVSLTQVLNLVGTLDDAPGDNTPRERFRGFLRDSVSSVAQISDYVDACVTNKGVQYNRALQDLVNYLGHFLGFQVAFGRYQGMAGEPGHDGHWQSPTGFHVVVEVKTTDVYAIKAATLVGYVDNLVSDKQIPSWEQAIGLYVVALQDPEVKQFENAIVAEKRTNQLRVIGARSLLSLADMMVRYDVRHNDILAMLRPADPSVDSLVGLMERLVAGSKAEEEVAACPAPRPVVRQVCESTELSLVDSEESQSPQYWITPVKSFPEESAVECIRQLVGRHGVYAYGDRTPGRKSLRVGDWLCFYSTDKAIKGVVAHARVASLPERETHPAVRNPDKYPWLFRVDSPCLYTDDPVALSPQVRSQMNAFCGRDPNGPWAWLVQGTKRVDRHDFDLITRQRG